MESILSDEEHIELLRLQLEETKAQRNTCERELQQKLLSVGELKREQQQLTSEKEQLSLQVKRLQLEVDANTQAWHDVHHHTQNQLQKQQETFDRRCQQIRHRAKALHRIQEYFYEEHDTLTCESLD